MNDSYKLRSELDKLNDKTAGAVQKDTLAAVRDSQGEINSRISEISMGMQELRGRFEENKYFRERQFSTYDSELETVTARLEAIEKQLSLIRNKAGITEVPEASAGTAKTASISPDTPDMHTGTDADAQARISSKVSAQKDMTNAYETAYTLFKEKKYAASRKEFESFIAEYPDTSLTDNAYFWIGETYYGAKDYEGAILAYEELLKKYPNSEKTGGALLKQGYSFIALGDRKTGTIILEKLIEKYPDSKEADLARKKL
jgi:tol-pal system protein YbgF